MTNDNLITLVDDKDLNNYDEIELLCAFELDNNKYIVYSKNELDYDGNNIVYSGKIVYRGSRQYIQNVNKEEYDKIKDIIKKMIDYNCEVSNV